MKTYRMLKMLPAILLVVVLLGGTSKVYGTLLVAQKKSWSLTYGGSSWDNMTASLDNATGGQVTVVPNLENLNQMLEFDALWIDLPFSSGPFLTTTEVANITTFISTGRRVVMMGENASWTTWNNQLLGTVGGSFSGSSFTGTTSTVLTHELTAMVGEVYVPAGGLAAAIGTPLFDRNWATLWHNNNVLTLLDVNVSSDSYWSRADNAQFATNVASWISVPEPATVTLLALGGLLLRRKRRA